MVNKKELKAYARVLSKVSPGSQLLRAWRLPGGISAEMTVLESEDETGHARRLVVRRPGPAALKRNPDIVKNEYHLLTVLHRKGLLVPMTILMDLSKEVIPSPYFIETYIDGQPDYAPADLHDFLHQFALHLVKIHDAAVSVVELPFLSRQNDQVERRLNIRPAQRVESMHESRIHQVLLAAWPLAAMNVSTLLHGDYWPGNVLWKEGELRGVVDWEDASLGDPLYDLSIARLDLLYICGLEAMTAFTSYYQSNRPVDTSHLPYWDLYAALRFIRLSGGRLDEWAAFFHPFGRRDMNEKTVQEYYQFFVAQAFDRLGLEL
jgi:aminoglycoside phosphotransferase (APT) family kinase protein